MAPLSSFSPFAPLTFSSLEPLLALETAWRPSCHIDLTFFPSFFFLAPSFFPFFFLIPFFSSFFPLFSPLSFFPFPFFFLFRAPLVTPGGPGPQSPPKIRTWIWSPSLLFLCQFGAPWRFLPWSPCLHLNLHGAPLVLFSVNFAPLTFSSLEPLLTLETAWRISRPFLRQFGTPDVNFAPLTFSSLGPLLALETAWRPSHPFLSIWRLWRFLPWSPCLHLKLHGAPLILFSVNLAPLTFSSLEPLLALETAWRPSCHIDLTFFPSFFFLAPSFFPFFFLIPFFSSFFPLFSPLSFFPFPFFFLFRAPLVTPGGPGPQSPPQDTPLLTITFLLMIGAKFPHKV